VLARAGTAAIDDRRFGDALDAFSSAAAMRPDDASFCFGAGVAAFMLGKTGVARRRFECALAIDPRHRPAATWLGDLHYREGRLDEAIATVEQARRYAPRDRSLREQLARLRDERRLHGRFARIDTPHFSLLHDPSADGRFVREVASRLEAARLRIGGRLGVYPAGPIGVVVYTREQFEAITNAAAWSVAAYDGRIRIPTGTSPEDGDELDRVLSHELVHAVIAMLAGRTTPAWLNEGLATALEPEGSTSAEALLAGSAEVPALSALHRGFAALPRRDAEIAYASSARAVRRLLQGHGAEAVVGLLQDLGDGAPFDRAFRQRTGMPYEDFAAAARRD
jgi:tetratricopeptide (TPR) repeat protein